MEGAPFSNIGLQPKQLEKEESIVLKSIDAVQDSIKEIDFKTIDEIFIDILSRIDTPSTREEIRKYFEMDGRYPIQVTYSRQFDTTHFGEDFSKGEWAPAAVSRFPHIIVHAREIVDDNGVLEKEDKLYLLKVLIHEVVHHLSFSVEKQEDENKPMVHSGISYGTPEMDGEVKESSFSLLNEGMTEIISDAIYSEYLARTGVGKEFGEKQKWYTKWYKRKEGIHRYSTYISERMSLMSFVDRIANYSGIPEEKIYQSLAVEYFSQGDLSRAEIMNELKDIPELTDSLLKMKENDQSAFANLSEKELDDMIVFLDKKQLIPVKALVGRDYVGEINQRRLADKKFFNVLR